MQDEQAIKSKPVGNIPPLVSTLHAACRLLLFVPALASHDSRWMLTFKICKPFVLKFILFIVFIIAV